LQGGNGNDAIGSFDLTRSASAIVTQDATGTTGSFERSISANDEAGDDILEGGSGSDRLNGGQGRDQLVGVSLADGMNAGFGEVDTLRAGQGQDTFILGNSIGVFYNDRRSRNRGRTDYAVIQDFKIAQGDRIQLKGRARNYQIGGSSRNPEIFLKTGRSTELIAIVQGSRFSNFSRGFVFV
jgi:Ca2+-binding RTX toxin-like protein